MLSTSAAQGRDGVRGLLVALAAVAVLVGMPGWKDLLSAGIVLISILGGMAVGVAALSARAARRYGGVPHS